MTVLVVATAFSDTLEQVMIEQSFASANDLLILTPSEQVKKELERIGFDVTLLSYHINQSWESRDKLFKKVAMPGEILNINFPDTNLPVWEILSLDRLSFFFNGEESIKQLQTLEMLEFDRVIVSLDIHSHLTMMVGLLAKQRGVRSIACQVDKYIQTEEFQSLTVSGYLDMFSEIVVGKKEDSEWLSRFLNVKPNHPLIIIRDLGGEYPEVVEDKEKKIAYRRGFGFGETDNVLFIPFDLPHEHEFSNYLATVNPEDKVLIWPVDSRAREKIGVLGKASISRVNGLVVDSLDMHRTADKVILFRKDWYIPELVVPWELVDA